MVKVEVIRGQPVQPPIEEVVIRMSKQDAETLRRRIHNGDARTVYSVLITDLDRALANAGIERA